MNKQQSSEEHLGLLTVKQVAKLLNMSTWWVYQNLDTIPHIVFTGKKGRRSIRFTKTAIDTFLHNNLTHLQREE